MSELPLYTALPLHHASEPSPCPIHICRPKFHKHKPSNLRRCPKQSVSLLSFLLLLTSPRRPWGWTLQPITPYAQLEVILRTLIFLHDRRRFRLSPILRAKAGKVLEFLHEKVG